MSYLSSNLRLFAGVGMSIILLFAGLLFLGMRLKKSETKTMTVWFPVFALFVLGCPIWVVYNMLRDDGGILYRLMWIIPVGVIVCYALVEAVYLLPGKYRIGSFFFAILLIMVCGKYVYSNSQFSKAENMYHVPDTVVKICDELKVEGWEIRVCMPLEFIQYTRQYSPYICLTYGRYVLYDSQGDGSSNMDELLDNEVLDTRAICEELRRTCSAYIVVKNTTVFDEKLEDYNLSYCKTIDGYDIYYDNEWAYREFVNWE